MQLLILSAEFRRFDILIFQQLLLCASQSLFACDTAGSPTVAHVPSIPPTTITNIDQCKANPPTYVFLQGWQLLALAVSLFVPKDHKILWYLKCHLRRNSDTKWVIISRSHFDFCETHPGLNCVTFSFVERSAVNMRPIANELWKERYRMVVARWNRLGWRFFPFYWKILIIIRCLISYPCTS